MGSENGGRIITIKSFQMAKTLVTNKQYKACVAAGACTPVPPAQNFGAAFDGGEQPVVGVSWDQAKAFSKWVGGRLPSEVEWEYAARSGGKNQRFPWGNEEATCARAVLMGCGYNATAPVCSKPDGNTVQGLCDMTGNAEEWVEDVFHPFYKDAPAHGRKWKDERKVQKLPSGYYPRVTRGCRWDDLHVMARVAQRGGADPGHGCFLDAAGRSRSHAWKSLCPKWELRAQGFRPSAPSVLAFPLSTPKARTECIQRLLVESLRNSLWKLSAPTKKQQ